MSGHKGEEYRSGGKLISVVLALVAAAFAALCILQLFGGEVSYRTIKTWQLRAALTEISRNIEKEDLDMRVARLSSGGIETRIVDEQGLDLLEPQSVCENSLAEYQPTGADHALRQGQHFQRCDLGADNALQCAAQHRRQKKEAVLEGA